jgi:hypothetical protein
MNTNADQRLMDVFARILKEVYETKTNTPMEAGKYEFRIVGNVRVHEDGTYWLENDWEIEPVK